MASPHPRWALVFAEGRDRSDAAALAPAIPSVAFKALARPTPPDLPSKGHRTHIAAAMSGSGTPAEVMRPGSSPCDEPSGADATRSPLGQCTNSSSAATTMNRAPNTVLRIRWPRAVAT